MNSKEGMQGHHRDKAEHHDEKHAVATAVKAQTDTTL